MSDTARMLDETVDRLLRKMLADGGVARNSAQLRDALAKAAGEAGLALALVPESQGGMGASLHDAGAIAWRWGYHAAPYPVAETMLAAAAGALAGLGESELGATLAAPARVGEKFMAPATSESCELFALAEAGTSHEALLTCDRAVVRSFRALSGETWFEFGANSQTASRPLPVGSVARLKMQGALLTAAAIAGATARIVEMTVEHANTRVQFGRPLGKFQAVQNLIADAAAEQVLCQAALAGAIDAFDRGVPEQRLTWAAKAQAGRAATVVSAAAHQTLGAIGFTEEHVLGAYTRRLWVWRDHWGRQSECEQLAARAACGDVRGLWRHLVDPQSSAEGASA